MRRGTRMLRAQKIFHRRMVSPHRYSRIEKFFSIRS